VTRTRLDLALLERGLSPTRAKAQALVMAGRVRVNGLPASKPGVTVTDTAALEVLPGPQHVGRGALKLEQALSRLRVDPAGAVAVDVGASTGGFTEVLLARGARRVHAVDVGRAQLHESLRSDSRVVVHDRTNARRLTIELLGETCDLGVVDVSFISLRLILPALAGVLRPLADAVVLVKPQFEVGRLEVGRGGLVTDPALHQRVVFELARVSQETGYGVLAACPSPITGAEGNREFFLHLRLGAPPMVETSLLALAQEAVTLEGAKP
jgi:23S rRNA (cytidine1920-2'-O)/16S rRNA (cytidine1409-2'-O)-methyltransferase